jgi:beta,beta-carotene 9',10'-dioxygenase
MWSVPGHYPGEPIFVADPEGASEDDGVLMTNVLDATKNVTYLLLLNATTMAEQARMGPTPHVVPHGYHGRYFA